MSEGNRERVKLACNDIVTDPDLMPEKNTLGEITKTKCNLGVQKVLHAVGYHMMDGMLANQMIKFMTNDPKWSCVEPVVAQRLAREGSLCMAGIEGKPSGHVAIIYPDGGMVYSSKWKNEAPCVANVGKRNEIMGANFAFDKEPLYFVLTNG